MKTIEVWKPVVGWEEYYEVSNIGRVRTIATSHIKAINVNKYGYESTRLIHKPNRFSTVKIHRLVAEAFIPNPYSYKEVNHIDGDKTNNRVENLEWCNRSQNIKHAHNHGLMKGFKSKLELVDVIDIWETCSKFGYKESATLLCNKYNVSRATIWCIVNGRSWKHELQNYVKGVTS